MKTVPYHVHQPAFVLTAQQQQALISSVQTAMYSSLVGLIPELLSVMLETSQGKVHKPARVSKFGTP